MTLQILNDTSKSMYDKSGVRWVIDFLDLAQWWADRRSKDPSTKVGAVIFRDDHTIVSMGYNGFPRGVHDKPELYADRDEKYPRVVHAELNAVVTAYGRLGDMRASLACPLVPCSECAKAIIQVGIRHVYSWHPGNQSEELHKRWKASFDLTREMFDQASVHLTLIDAGVRSYFDR